MPVHQELAPLSPVRRRDHRHARALVCPEVGRRWLGLLLAFGLTVLAVAALPAQGLGSLQAQARVVATQPVQEALLVVRGMILPGPGEAWGAGSRRTRLALVRLEARPGAEPRRRVVTVSFIRN